MTLWYLNRALLVHSSKFDITDTTVSLSKILNTHIISPCLIGKGEIYQNNPELRLCIKDRWDPAVTPLCDTEGNRSYSFSMGYGVSYTIQGTLQDYSAGLLVGRGTRVFAATNDGSEDKALVALKDI